MSKIARYAGDLIAFAKNATGTNRTIFGSTSQSDDLTENIDNGSYPVGWEIVGPSDKPTIEDFSGAMFTTSQLVAYLHQMGVAEWSGLQEYQIGSISNRAGDLYSCKTVDHVSATPPESDPTNWKSAIPADLLNTARIDIASATTVDLTANAPNTRHINITGSNSITSFTVAAGQCYFVRFDAAATLANNASIVTQLGADIVADPGDTCIIRATASDVVEVLCYTQVSGGGIGIGQTWTDEPTRMTGVTYTNTSLRTIVVSVTVSVTSTPSTLTVESEVISEASTTSGTLRVTVRAEVQPSKTYILSSGTIERWKELK